MAAKEEERGAEHIASMFNSFQEHLNCEQQKREVYIMKKAGKALPEK